MHSCPLNDACQPLLTQIVALEALNDLTKDQALQKLQQQVQQTKTKAAAQGCSNQDLQQALYALAALIDEQVPLRCPKLRGGWRSALLQTLFQENRGGEHFFLRLDQILDQPEQQAVLRIFGLCLVYGFRGKFSESDTKQLAVIRERVRRHLQPDRLARELCTTRSPAHPPVPKPVNHARWIWPTAIAVCLALVGMASVRKSLDRTSESLLRQLPKVLDPVKLS